MTDFKSKYFELKQFGFTKEDVIGAIKDLERFKQGFEKALKNTCR